MNQSLLNSLGIAALGLTMTTMLTLFYRSRDAATKRAEQLARENVELMHRVNSLEIQQAVQAQAIVPLSAGLQAAWVAKLTHAHTPELDQLMTLLGPPSRMTTEELKRFETLLYERIHAVDDVVDDEEREIARLLPTLIRQVQRDFTELRALPFQLIVARTGAINEMVGVPTMTRLGTNTGADAVATKQRSERGP